MLRPIQRLSLRRQGISLILAQRPKYLRPKLQPLSLSIEYDCRQRRTFLGLPTMLVPPIVFGCLVIALWTWKCFMMVLFQNKIIYMPGVPPNARKETIADYKNECGGIQWREERIRSVDRTRISLCWASVDSGLDVSQEPMRIYILYFQGNASSLPPRLPFLSPVLRMLQNQPLECNRRIRYVMVCCSYRGYWTSKGRPSEKGISQDAAAALEWIRADHGNQARGKDQPIPVIIWGQSIGAGVATNLAARTELFSNGLRLKTLILETPFLSVRAMLETLYPQKWLPYRHLWPFLWNHLDSWKAFGILGEKSKLSVIKVPSVLILEAGKDELVPKSHGDMLEKKCLDVGLQVKKKVISGALHTEVMVRPEGRLAVVEAIHKVAREVHAENG